MPGKVSCAKYEHLQQFCKPRKGSANYRTTFARRRSGVRIPSAPLLKTCVLQDKLRIKDERPAASGALVQRPCSTRVGMGRCCGSDMEVYFGSVPRVDFYLIIEWGPRFLKDV